MPNAADAAVSKLALPGIRKITISFIRIECIENWLGYQTVR
jgi:hypothetical protein